MGWKDGVFLAAGLISVVAGIAAVTRRSPVYSALWLLVAMVGVSVLFYLYAAPFVAMMQVVVYAGAILVLVLFVIMLLNVRPEEMKPEAPAGWRATGGLCALLLLAILAAAFLTRGGGEAGTGPIPADAPGGAFGSPEAVGRALFADHVLPFEALSVLIVVALVGAVLLAKRKM
jgi:NADH-quinone oxidoreductase subunit J